MRTIARTIPVAALLLAGPWIAQAAGEKTAGQTREDQKAELLEHIEDLQRDIPKSLRTELMIISMKLATGYCSPYRVQRFEENLAKLDAGEKRKFAEELETVRAHPLWPSMDDLPDSGQD